MWSSVLSFVYSSPVLLNAGAEEMPKDLLGMLLHSNAFNVLIALVIMVWLGKKFNLLGGLDSQGQTIALALQTAEADRLAASAQLKAAEARLQGVTADVEAVLAKAKQSADQLSSHILVSAEAEASRIIENARQRVLQTERSAVQLVQTRLLSETLDTTRQQMTDRLQDPHDRRRTIEQFIDELPTLPVSSH
jgi:F0F1-type ATP synthase membrane subunit b/b'